MQVPTLDEDRHQHGRRPGHPAAVAARGRRRRPHGDRRPEADRHQGQALDRRLQAPRGPVDRHQGHAARRPHVGVPRPADRRRHPPHPRLPRPARRRRGTAGATTRSASTTRPCSPRSTTTRSTPPAAWTSRSSPRRPTTPPARPCWTPSGSRSARPTTPTPPHPSSAVAAVARSARQEEVESQMAKKALINKAAAQAEVQGPRLHPLPPLRAGPLGVPQVRPLPDVPARAGPRRRDPRPDEVELVRRNDDDD